MIKQNIIFVENRAGSLQKVTGLLAEKGIDIYGFACFDAPEFALFRMVTDQADEAEKILSENGYMNRTTEVIAVDLKDQVGGLNEVLKVLGECNVNLDYIYTSYHRGNSLPIMILQAEDVFMTENVLKNNGFRVLSSLED
ncbi:amino acid-binding protein [Blautia sp. HCP28S3_G10]|uniref:amino acid-binding protein n=1 Tax=Blautia sp. HCP28S3_G10 TaxID=3438908 RepID=UPI003F8B7B39